ncbi:MAG: VCBS repeat-containing protein [Deltaproteobacteria bacterium]|nr:VCBS repeat-containing protein [Deltaproteobacteria bacterium]MBP7287487.1 VCBS repeat-containing protein [Nannocystaceae bacterium]
MPRWIPPRRARPRAAATSALLVVAPTLVVFATSTPAQASIIDPSGVVLPGDFNGDDVVDIVVSSPETNCGKGAIYVLLSGTALTTWTRDTSGILGVASCDDLFGASLAVGDIDNDGYDDLDWATPLQVATLDREVSSEIDWMRFWWRFLTRQDSPQPELAEVLEFMAFVQAEYPWGYFEVWPSLREALLDEASGMAVYVTRFDAIADEMGVYNEES